MQIKKVSNVPKNSETYHLKLLKHTIPEYFKKKYRFYVSQIVKSALKDLLLANMGNKN